MYTRKGFNTRFRCLWIVSEYEEDYTNRSYHIFVPMYIVITSAGIHADSIFPKRTEAACCSCRASNKKADYIGVNQFDVLLVFMFDRLGRRDDETPFVVQWFVQQGIEVWSTKEGEQRFDNHVDKLLNYIRFWQASGESEKTAIRVRTKHSQMVQEGEWRGGLVPYGYRLEFLGRTNKKGQPVRDLVIDETESAVIKEIYRLIVDEGYGTNRVANILNEKGILTKRGHDTLARNIDSGNHRQSGIQGHPPLRRGAFQSLRTSPNHRRRHL